MKTWFLCDHWIFCLTK